MDFLNRMKDHAGRINDYFANAVRAWIWAEDDAARDAALTAAKVAASLQRRSMVDYLRGLSSDFAKELGAAQARPARVKLESLASQIAKKDWGLVDVFRAKRHLYDVDAEYAAALAHADPEVFERRWPHLFAQHSEGEEVLALGEAGEAEPTDEEKAESAVDELSFSDLFPLSQDDKDGVQDDEQDDSLPQNGALMTAQDDDILDTEDLGENEVDEEDDEEGPDEAESESVLVCQSCGRPNSCTARFCQHCGKPIADHLGQVSNASHLSQQRRRWFCRCDYCNGWITFGAILHWNGRFCSHICAQHYASGGKPAFCGLCIEQTTPESIGGAFSLNYVLGSNLMVYGDGDPCPVCHSIVMRMWVWALIPVYAGPKHRVIFTSQGPSGGPIGITESSYLSRRLRPDATGF